MEKYSKAVSEKHSQFKQREAHPMEKYIGRTAMCYGERLEIVGYTRDNDGIALLIAGASKMKDCYWDYLDAEDVIFKKCKAYCYASVSNLID